MAGYWIAWTKGLPRKPEVFKIARELKMDRYRVAALLMDLWAWADSETTDGTILGMSTLDIDDVVDTPGLGEAMMAAGWLRAEKKLGLIFPNWERWNATPAKRRLLDAERKRKQRDADKP